MFSKLVHGRTRCPLGEISNWKDFVPGGIVRLISEGPQKCNCRFTISRTALLFLMVLAPGLPMNADALAKCVYPKLTGCAGLPSSRKDMKPLARNILE